MAEAAPTQRFIKLQPPAPETVVAQSMQTPEPPLPVPEPARPYITLRPPAPEPAPEARYAALEPPVHSLLGAAARRPAQAMREPDEDESLPEPPAPVPPPRPTQFAHRSLGRSGPIEVAEFPEPPRPPSQRALAAAELVPLGPHSHGFSLIPVAAAAPFHHPVAGGGSWAVQVGAFSNEGQASAATAMAREHVRDVLGSAHTVVAGVRQPGGTLYRARLSGLSHEAAAEACERLSHARTSCMVVSPEAQR